VLEKTGMDTEFASIWKAVGWSTFAEISEEGSRDLTIQFLCILWKLKMVFHFDFSGMSFQ